jgi:predicted LPLAT superfamily acyltransferase
MNEQRSKHWADERERGSFVLMRLTAWLARRLGRRALTPLLYVIVFYFYVFGRRARHSAYRYQQYLASWGQRPDLRPNARKVFAQFMTFAEHLLDKLDAWNGRLRFEHVVLHDPDGVRSQLNTQRGQMLVGAHLGNLEVCRALAETGERVKMNVLVHTRHAERFNRLLGEAGASHVQLIQVSELDPATMLQLSERLERGEWLAIAGDRVALSGARYAEVDFLGHPARFPQGPWMLAGLLKCPVNLLFCLKQQGRYHVHIERFADAIEWKRNNREQIISQWIARYADRLGKRCLQAPLQWFNFFPFWSER